MVSTNLKWISHLFAPLLIAGFLAMNAFFIPFVDETQQAVLSHFYASRSQFSEIASFLTSVPDDVLLEKPKYAPDGRLFKFGLSSIEKASAKDAVDQVFTTMRFSQIVKVRHAVLFRKEGKAHLRPDQLILYSLDGAPPRITGTSHLTSLGNNWYYVRVKPNAKWWL